MKTGQRPSVVKRPSAVNEKAKNGLFNCAVPIRQDKYLTSVITPTGAPSRQTAGDFFIGDVIAAGFGDSGHAFGGANQWPIYTRHFKNAATLPTDSGKPRHHFGRKIALFWRARSAV
jgi:hypothetical protein